MYEALENISKALKKAGIFKRINIGSDFTINKNVLPLCVIMPGNGSVEAMVAGKMEAHVIGLLHNNRDLEKKRTQLIKDTMGAMIDNYGGPVQNVGLSFDAEALSIFGVILPVTAPYAAFRLTYDVEFSL